MRLLDLAAVVESRPGTRPVASNPEGAEAHPPLSRPEVALQLAAARWQRMKVAE